MENTFFNDIDINIQGSTRTKVITIAQHIYELRNVPICYIMFYDSYNLEISHYLKARSHRQNVAGAFLERWGEGAEFWQRSSPRTKWQTKSKTRALP